MAAYHRSRLPAERSPTDDGGTDFSGGGREARLAKRLGRTGDCRDDGQPARFGKKVSVGAVGGVVGAVAATAVASRVTDEVLARAPRAELEAVELKDGKLISHMRLQFASGMVWEFDVPKIGKKNAKELVFALGGSVT